MGAKLQKFVEAYRWRLISMSSCLWLALEYNNEHALSMPLLAAFMVMLGMDWDKHKE